MPNLLNQPARPTRANPFSSINLSLSGRNIRGMLCLVPVLALTAIVLSSCMTMSKKQCRTTEWQLQGVNDALRGRPHSRFDQHVKTCKRADIVPDRDAWLVGHKQGARRYCQPSNAYEVGQRGRTYYNICEPDQHTIFVALYKLGSKERSLIYRRDQAAANIVRLENELEELEKMLERANVDGPKSRKTTKSRRQDLEWERGEFSDAVDDLARFRRRLQLEGMWNMAGLTAN